MNRALRSLLAAGSTAGASAALVYAFVAVTSERSVSPLHEPLIQAWLALVFVVSALGTTCTWYVLTSLLRRGSPVGGVTFSLVTALAALSLSVSPDLWDRVQTAHLPRHLVALAAGAAAGATYASVRSRT